MTDVDPITFQIIRHRLHSIVDEATIALKNVSGSPTTTEGHDMMVSLYNADGELMIGGVGFLHHITSASQAVKHIIERFSDSLGINEDDAFFLNDPYVAALHAPDIYIISPIHIDGVLVGFVANFVHVNDIGAIDPGGFSPNARDCFDEGFQSPGVKIIERGSIRTDFVDTLLNMVRDPGAVQLDLNSQLAANHVAKTRMRRLHEEYGNDVVASVATSLIDESERLLRDRLSELVDGTFHVRQYVDAGGLDCKVELAVTKEADTLHFDFSGSSPQLPIALNCTYWATWGSLFSPIYPLLAWDLTWNQGVAKPISMSAPEGTVVNATRPAPISIATVGIVQTINNLSTMVLSKILGASDGYRHRATGVWHGSHGAVRMHGRDATGRYFVGALTDSFCGSGGGRATQDGVDLGGEVSNVVSRWANVESHELQIPMLYHYRRMVTDSGGPGLYRGGLAHEFGFSPHRTADGGFKVTLFGKGTDAPMSMGTAGGYPGSNMSYETLRGTDSIKIPGRKDAFKRTDSHTVSWGETHLSESDVQHIGYMGGGGYGDPIARDPAGVVNDLLSGAISGQAANEIYGVILAEDRQTVDGDLTARRRIRIREERVGGSVEASLGEPSPAPRDCVTLSEHLVIDQAGAISCGWCQHQLCEAEGWWKMGAIRRNSKPSVAGPQRHDGQRFILAEFFCPRCGTMLENEILMNDDQPVNDRWNTVRSAPKLETVK
jgi:N-methylhydantoinase B